MHDDDYAFAHVYDAHCMLKQRLGEIVGGFVLFRLN